MSVTAGAAAASHLTTAPAMGSPVLSLFTTTVCVVSSALTCTSAPAFGLPNAPCGLPPKHNSSARHSVACPAMLAEVSVNLSSFSFFFILVPDIGNVTVSLLMWYNLVMGGSKACPVSLSRCVLACKRQPLNVAVLSCKSENRAARACLCLLIWLMMLVVRLPRWL